MGRKHTGRREGAGPCGAADGKIKAIDQRSLGTTGISVSVLGAGCSTLGAFWQGHPDREWKLALEAALSCGISLFDTSDAYGRGRSERLLGQVLRHRDDAIVITKAGLIKTPASSLRAFEAGYGSSTGSVAQRTARASSTAWRSIARGRCLTAAYVRRAVAASRRRLMREHIDVFMLHSPRPSEMRDPELIEALARLRGSGDIRAWGVSAANLTDAAAALEMPGVDCVEVGLSICDRDTAPPLIAAAATRDVAVIARQPFGSGALLRRIQGAGRSDAPGPSSAVSEESILSTCLHYPLSIDGVSAVIAGMSKASHVVQSSTLLQAPPTSLADLDPISAYVCAGARRAD